MKYFTKFQEEKFSKVPGREGKKMKDRITSIHIWGLEEGERKGQRVREKLGERGFTGKKEKRFKTNVRLPLGWE